MGWSRWLGISLGLACVVTAGLVAHTLFGVLNFGPTITRDLPRDDLHALRGAFTDRVRDAYEGKSHADVVHQLTRAGFAVNTVLTVLREERYLARHAVNRFPCADNWSVSWVKVDDRAADLLGNLTIGCL